MSGKNNGSKLTNGDDNDPKESEKFAVDSDPIQDDVTIKQRINSSGDNKRSRFEMLESRFRRAKTDLKSNRYHRIILLLAIVIILLLLVVIILSVSVGSRRAVSPRRECETSDCLRAAASVVAAVNTSFDPCTDFWSFACKGWIDRNRISDNIGSYSVRDQIRNEIRHELRHYIDLIPQGVDAADPQFKVKTFYSSCLSVEDIEYTAFSTLKYDIEGIGGWSLITKWSFQSWDKNIVIERLHTKYGVTPYFKVSVGVDDLDPNQPYIIKIEPSGLGLPSKNYYYDTKYAKQTEAYKNFIRELAKLFEAQAIHANQLAENIFNYEKRIAEVTPDLEEYQQPANYMKRRYSIKELTSLAPSIKWLKILQTYYPNAQLTENTRVLLAFESYFRNISHIISTTDNSAINDYLMLRLMTTYAPYLSKAFRLIHNEFQQSMNGIESNELSVGEYRWEFCVDTASKFMGPALGAMFVRRKFAERSANAQTAKSDIIGAIQNAVLANLDSFVWARSDDARHLIQQKIRQLELLVSHPEFVTSEEDIKNYYKEFIVQNSFYHNIVAGINFLNRKSETLLRARESPLKRIDYSWKLLPYDVDIAYEYAGNRLTVAAGILQYPIFDRSLPAAIQFGSLGFQVATQLLRALDLIGLQYGLPDFRLSAEQTFLRDEVKQYLDERLLCLYDDLQDALRRTQILNANLTLSQTYIDIGALLFAYEAYKSRVGERGDEGQLPGIVQNNDQLFYISFAQAMCESVRPQKSLVMSGYETRLPSQIRVMTALRQSQNFANVFGCDASAHMASDQMCHLWPHK